MFSRSAGKVEQQPRRTKSSSSVSLKPVFKIDSSIVDTDALHQHALTAANLAYERASRLHLGDKGSTIADKGQELGKMETAPGKPPPEKRQSIRFAGPNATPLMIRSITRREAPPYHAGHNVHQLSVPTRNNSSSANDSPLAAMAEDFDENDITSMQSSYRKLRKAKSMFTPGKASSTMFSGNSPGAKRQSERHSWQSNAGSEEYYRMPGPGLRRSYSFLQSVTDRIPTSKHQDTTHDAAIQLARDTYLQQVDEQRLKEKPSFLNISKRCKSQRPFRRTVRSNRTNSYGTAVASPMASIEPAKASIGQKTRSLSQTLKKKIKQVFRRSKDDRSAIPTQHLNACHAHYRNYSSSLKMASDDYFHVPEPDPGLIRRVSSRESTEHDSTMFVDKCNRPGSIRSVSIHSDDGKSNDRSRVTSWTDSTAANTMTMPQMMERKRLSIIREDCGPHQPSLPSRRYGSLGDEHTDSRHPISQKTADRVQAERVYSALQRKMDEDNREAGFQCESSPSYNSEDQELQRSTSIPKPSPNRNRGAGFMANTFAGEGDLGAKYSNCHRHCAGIRERLVSNEIAEMNGIDLSPPRRPLHEVKSSFFPPSMRIERSSTSPFRRILKANHEGGGSATTNADKSDPSGSGAHVNLSRYRVNGSVAGSESIYSRSPGGRTATAIGSSLSLPASESSGEAGTAFILASETARNRLLDSPSITRRYSSADLSGTWRRFMADEVASLEDARHHDDQACNVVSLRRSGHRREETQIDGDSVCIGRQQTSKDKPKQPLGILHGDRNSQPPFKHKSISAIGGGNKFMRTSSFPDINTVTQKENNPFNQRSAYPRKISASDIILNLRQKQSQASLYLQNDPNGLSSKINPRNSPERIERLRRLKSTSSTSLLKATSQTRNNAAHDSCTVSSNTWQHDHDSINSDTSPSVHGEDVVGGQEMVENFLKVGGRDARSSDEKETNPAFL